MSTIDAFDDSTQEFVEINTSNYENEREQFLWVMDITISCWPASVLIWKGSFLIIKIKPEGSNTSVNIHLILMICWRIIKKSLIKWNPELCLEIILYIFDFIKWNAKDENVVYQLYHKQRQDVIHLKKKKNQTNFLPEWFMDSINSNSK